MCFSHGRHFDNVEWTCMHQCMSVKESLVYAFFNLIHVRSRCSSWKMTHLFSKRSINGRWLQGRKCHFHFITFYPNKICMLLQVTKLTFAKHLIGIFHKLFELIHKWLIIMDFLDNYFFWLKYFFVSNLHEFHFSFEKLFFFGL